MQQLVLARCLVSSTLNQLRSFYFMPCHREKRKKNEQFSPYNHTHKKNKEKTAICSRENSVACGNRKLRLAT